jgi:hypothetical protein
MPILSLWAMNISAGTAKAGWEGQMFRNYMGAAEFECQSSNCIAILSARANNKQKRCRSEGILFI